MNIDIDVLRAALADLMIQNLLLQSALKQAKAESPASGDSPPEPVGGINAK